MAIGKFIRHKAPGIEQIQVKLITAGVDQFFLRSLNSLIMFGIMRTCLKSGTSLSLYPSIRKVIKHTVTIIEAYYFCKVRIIFFNFLHSGLTPYAEERIGNH